MIIVIRADGLKRQRFPQLRPRFSYGQRRCRYRICDTDISRRTGE
jgi:hypothetical protein